MREYFGDKLLTFSKRDKRVYILDGDLTNSVKTNYIAEQNPSKFIQCGISEQNMIGVAAGLASIGIQPWVTTFTSFLTKRALDQIIVSVAQPKLDVKLVGSYSGFSNSKTGKSHQGIEDISIMRTIPNMVVLTPGDANELGQMMYWANKYNGPVYIRITRDSQLIFDEEYDFGLGKAVNLKNGDDITIISTGTHTKYALEAAEKLKEESINASVLHMPSIKPIDEDAIIEASLKTRAIITVEDHSIIGGLGSAVAEVLVENCPCYMGRIGIRDKNIEAGTDEELLEKYELSTKHIIDKAKKYLNKKI
jgi:transketolase